jgi:hypothetical protein
MDRLTADPSAPPAMEHRGVRLLVGLAVVAAMAAALWVIGLMAS